MDPYVGEIRLLPYIFAPYGWLQCDGSLQSIATYQTLFAVIGTTYGGNGSTNFQLPDLRGFIPVGPNRTDPSTVQIDIGGSVGEANVSLAINQLPSHNHTMNGKNTTTLTNKLTIPATNAQPSQVQFNGTSSSPVAQKAFSSTNIPDMAFASLAIGPYGAYPVAAHSNQQPYLPLNFMIAWDGVYPSPG